MKLARYIALMTTYMTLALSTSTQATPIGVFGNFEDNGLTVLEYRDDGTTWEWLDLTVTNGISYNSLVTDLNNDGLLNNSDDVLYGSSGALADVVSLTDDLRGGWNTVSSQQVTLLINSFFDLTLEVGNQHYFEENSELVEYFVKAFGDSFYEGSVDNGFPVYDYYGQNRIWNTEGLTSDAYTAWGSPYNISVSVANDISSYNATTMIASKVDAIWIFMPGKTDLNNALAGTWLTRQVAVAAPSSISLLVLVLIGLLARRNYRGER